MSLDVSDWVAIGSAVLAVVSLILTSRVVHRQTELQYETLRAEMDAEVIAWAKDALDLISEASALARGRGVSYPADEFARLASDVEFKLSAAVDSGRLFFPNESPWAEGREKEGAFQGIRPPILDALVFSCCQIEQIKSGSGPDHETADFLVKCRRLLASEAQNAIDPRRRGAMLDRLKVGRKDDVKSNFDVAYDLGLALDGRYPNLPVVQGFLAAQRKHRGKT